MKEARLASRLTQRALADQLHEQGVSVDQAAIARMESGSREPRLSEAVVIARLLGLNLAGFDDPVDIRRRLRSLVAKISENNARKVGAEILIENDHAEVQDILASHPELREELSEEQRQTLASIASWVRPF